ncbi:DUF421 domain-containing protein [Macrococcus brunensis]|uniref:DUF421 domain-containing protein n=1 Tax=Macrococcus brunensis TaxID=198483 RepID=A0A4R6BFP3_9STAP|nr:DUF421 domain-containing protein [Macrococcus brunensis]
MFFDNFNVIIRTFLIGIMAYTALIILLRASGKRTLTKLNAFDLIVTIALGSTLASIMTSKDIALLQGIVAFATLIGLQLLLTKLSLINPKVSEIIKSNPTLLYYKGQFLKEAMKKERLLETEVKQAVRSQGHASLSEIEAIILETDGTLSILKPDQSLEQTLLEKVSYPSKDDSTYDN